MPPPTAPHRASALVTPHRASALVTALLASAAAASASAFSLSNTLGNSMVLQRDVVTTSLWGFSTPGDLITVSSDGYAGGDVSVNATASASGVFIASFPALGGSLTPFSLHFSVGGQVQATLSDVVAGDVLLCSGQSNMQLSIQMALNATEEISAIDAFGPFLRVFYVAESSSATPLQDLSGVPSLPWSRASSKAMGQDSWSGFSATCWFTGRDLFTGPLNRAVPVGLIESSVGGTAIRQWVPASVLAQCGTPYNSPVPYGTAPYALSQHFNAMVNPFTTGPTNLRSVVWDQAESDSWPQCPLEIFTCSAMAQVLAWRALFTPAPSPALPWVFVHLQPYSLSPNQCCLDKLRAAQLAASLLPGVGVASAIDLGCPDSPYGNVHFQNKQVISARLVASLVGVAFPALSPPSAYPPPAYASQTAYFINSTSASSNGTRSSSGGGASGNGTAVIEITFSSLGRGTLLLLPPGSNNNTCPPAVNPANCSDFEILGSDGNSYHANASLVPPPPSSGSALPTLVLTSSSPLPFGVYGVGSTYAWSMWPLARLFSSPDGTSGDPSQLFPVLPWNQAVIIPGVPFPPPPSVRGLSTHD